MGMNILRTATRHSDAVLHEHGMHFHLPTAPRMPRIPDFSDFNNMGVVLITCTIAVGHTWRWRKTVRSRGRFNRQTLDASSQSRRSADCTIATSGVLPERRCHSDHLPLSADFNGVPTRPQPLNLI